jgi:hypothetical protein
VNDCGRGNIAAVEHDIAMANSFASLISSYKINYAQVDNSSQISNATNETLLTTGEEHVQEDEAVVLDNTLCYSHKQLLCLPQKVWVSYYC